MDNEQFQNLQNKLDEINKNIVISHNQHLNLIQNMINRQIKVGKVLGVEDATETFEPYYLRSLSISPDYPEVFNKYGEKMEFFFISDHEFAHQPNSSLSRYIIWDRYNYGLKTHFYTHEQMFRTVGKPERKFGMLLEPPSIKPQSYKMVFQNKDYLEKNFKAIFTFDVQVLANLRNAKFAPLLASVWLPQKYMSENNYKNKTKKFSMVSSSKEMCSLHVVRKKLAMHLKHNGGGR